MATLFHFGFAGTGSCSGTMRPERSSDPDTSNTESDAPEKPPGKKPVRCFQKKWMDRWSWVRYDAEGVMYCETCREVSKVLLNQLSLLLCSFQKLLTAILRLLLEQAISLTHGILLVMSLESAINDTNRPKQ